MDRIVKQLKVLVVTVAIICCPMFAVLLAVYSQVICGFALGQTGIESGAVAQSPEVPAVEDGYLLGCRGMDYLLQSYLTDHVPPYGKLGRSVADQSLDQPIEPKTDEALQAAELSVQAKPCSSGQTMSAGSTATPLVCSSPMAQKSGEDIVAVAQKTDEAVGAATPAMDDIVAELVESSTTCLNCDSDNPLFDETRFVRIQEYTLGEKLDVREFQSGSIILEPDKTYAVMVFYHNSSPDPNYTVSNSRLQLTFPRTLSSDEKRLISGMIGGYGGEDGRFEFTAAKLDVSAHEALELKLINPYDDQGEPIVEAWGWYGEAVAHAELSDLLNLDEDNCTAAVVDLGNIAPEYDNARFTFFVLKTSSVDQTDWRCATIILIGIACMAFPFTVIAIHRKRRSKRLKKD